MQKSQAAVPQSDVTYVIQEYRSTWDSRLCTHTFRWVDAKGACNVINAPDRDRILDIFDALVTHGGMPYTSDPTKLHPQGGRPVLLRVVERTDRPIEVPSAD